MRERGDRHEILIVRIDFWQQFEKLGFMIYSIGSITILLILRVRIAVRCVL